MSRSFGSHVSWLAEFTAYFLSVAGLDKALEFPLLLLFCNLPLSGHELAVLIIICLCYLCSCRAAIEDQYAKSLAKLARTQYGDGEEGTLRDAWREVRSGVQADSAAHASFATKVIPCFDSQMATFCWYPRPWKH